jgi:DNA-binding NarL/FixJ family response regulator
MDLIGSMPMPAGRLIAVIADENEIVRAGLAAMLRSDLGFGRVIETGSFDEAVDCLGREPEVALAVFDFALPGMYGMASLQSVRSVFPVVRVAVIADAVQREDVLDALTAGVHGYVPKTLTVGQIACALSLVVDGHISVPSSVADLAPGAPARTSPAGHTRRPAIRIADLTSRQRDVLLLIAAGKTNKEIADELQLAEGTVRTHVYALFRTLGVRNRVSARAAAISDASWARLLSEYGQDP